MRVCVSLPSLPSWGHDFRPSYRKLEALRALYPGVPIMAATATATEPVRKDILSQLALTAPFVLQQSFDRPNLCYQVCSADGVPVCAVGWWM
jgi:bloom syndrome protein